MVVALFQAQCSAPDEATLQFFGIAGILQAKPFQSGLDSFNPAAQQFVQEFGNPAAVDTTDAAIDEHAQIAQDQPLRKQQFKPVRGQRGQRP